MLAITTASKQEQKLKQNFIQRRLALGYTQASLGERSGVSHASVKRFESSGKISLTSFLKLAMVLECLSDFDKIGSDTISSQEMSIKDLQAQLTKNTRKRGYK